MNIDDKIEAKVKAIDEKMKDGTGIDLFKLQSCTQQMHGMGSFGMRGCKHDEEDKSVKSASLLIEKLMLLQSLNMFEESISTK